MKVKSEISVCVVVAAASLVVAAACHHFAPGLGPLLKPLLWPVALSPVVRPRYALASAIAVPLVSCAVNGMPVPAAALALSALSAALVAVVAAVRPVVRRLARAEF